MTCIMPIGGNKGGTGKSVICGSLGIALAKRGKRTLIIDLDLGASNLHTMMGMSLPSRFHLKNFLRAYVNCFVVDADVIVERYLERIDD